MIEVYSWATPNGHKVHIMLEECGLPYRVIPVDIGAGDQFKPEFLAISPNNKIPAIIDPDGPGRQADLAVRIGRDPALPRRQDRHASCPPTCARYEVLQWLMFQMGGVGPMLGQAHHFRIYAPEKIAYAIDRYTNEAQRLYGVIDKQLGQAATSPATNYTHRRHRDLPVAALVEEPGHRLERLSRTSRAGSTRSPHARPCSAASRCWPTCASRSGDKAREVLFGSTQYQRR